MDFEHVAVYYGIGFSTNDTCHVGFEQNFVNKILCQECVCDAALCFFVCQSPGNKKWLVAIFIQSLFYCKTAVMLDQVYADVAGRLAWWS